jgi:hypothetical protein
MAKLAKGLHDMNKIDYNRSMSEVGTVNGRIHTIKTFLL